MGHREIMSLGVPLFLDQKAFYIILPFHIQRIGLPNILPAGVDVHTLGGESHGPGKFGVSGTLKKLAA